MKVYYAECVTTRKNVLVAANSVEEAKGIASNRFVECDYYPYEFNKQKFAENLDGNYIKCTEVSSLNFDGDVPQVITIIEKL